MLQENLPELLHLFEKAGEAISGVYGQKLLGPVFEQIKGMGFGLESGSGTSTTHSVEYWGPPEERECCICSSVKRADGTPPGTLVNRFFHDHIRFRIPRVPAILALQRRKRSAIMAQLSRASVRDQDHH